MKPQTSGSTGWNPLAIPSPGSISVLVRDGDGAIRVSDWLYPSRIDNAVSEPLDSYLPPVVAGALCDLITEIPNAGDSVISHISAGSAEHEVRISMSHVSEGKILVVWGGIVPSGIWTAAGSFHQAPGDIPNMLSRHDESLAFTSATSSSYTLFGYHPSELKGISLLHYIHPDDRHRVESDYLPLLSSPDVVRTRYRLRNSRNEYQWVESLFSSDFSPDEFFSVIMGSTREMDGIVRAEMAARGANAKLNLLTSIVRHDLMNQITGLIGYLDILEDMVEGDDLLLLIKKELEIVTKIRRLVDLSREYQGIGLHTPGYIDVDAVIYKILSRPKFSGIGRYCSLDGLRVYADRMFEQVLHEMVANSLAYGGEGVSVRFFYTIVDEELIIVMEDTGPGIEDSEKAHIFSRNYPKRRGYGLYLATEILDITGIRIREVGKFGEGARFEIVVPADGFRFGPSGR